MEALPIIAVRWALYGDLGLLFGMPLFGLYALRGRERETEPAERAVYAALAIAGFLLSALGFALTAAAMSGTTLAHLDPAILAMLLRQTSLGWAWLGRMVALALALGVSAWRPIPAGARFVALAACGGFAVSTLAWFGHGAASEGAPGYIHLGADIVHLLAASAWIGALAMLLVLVGSGVSSSHRRVMAAHDALASFSTIGTMLVGLIIATGVINGAFLVGADAITLLGRSLYGRLLLAKLMAFAAMLGCAALNRFRLTPRLAEASGQPAIADALAALRRSIAIETVLAILVLALVGWLGTLEPPLPAS
ncbi:copper homeostasis membrane protein CopD [Sphingopyxis indica]|uniref:copper homeostasis membrane protein CopD n=1 Tax=Sphingopyxis indica TaxID=436663 RepID=UPI00293927C6|nr:copper homeostasis membrane protein CopD [Sphingopyxis indica]WOF44969.1 copper homeostasis membrane protein CopD [Sphingopyxis indica]